MKTVGIIGAGSFGLFLAEKLDTHCTVKVSSRRNHGGKWASSLKEVAQCEYIIPSIPLGAYRATLNELATHIRVDSVIVDVCSVKEKPVQTIKEVLPDHKIVATHPLFGPESASDAVTGHRLVVCPDISDSDELGKIVVFAQMLGLHVEYMTSQEHDQEMAVVQGLTFFIAKALHDTGIHHQKLETPSFKRLLHLAELESHHSNDLFRTIQTGNHYTEQVRKRFIKSITELDKNIHE